MGLLMLVTPGVIFLITFPLSGRLKPGIRKVYRILGGTVVFLGSGISLYLASYTGDQGGIAAYFFQIAVILVYLVLWISLFGLNWLLITGESRTVRSQQGGER
jgi:hypothetical protein